MIEFDKLQFAKNVSCLLKDKGIKIGDYEKSVGVSAGYLSRVSKDDAIKPNIDFIVRTANLLDVSIDTLLEADLSDLSSTELLFLSFLHKLQSDTIGEQLEWKRESADVLNSIETYGGGGSRHPLFYGFQTGTTEDPLYPEPVFTGLASFSSNALGLNTVIDDDCFSQK